MSSRSSTEASAVPAAEAPLSTARLLAYSAPAVPLAVMLIPLNALLPYFYNGVLGVSASVVGLALLLSRLSDVVIDPVFGLLSDRTRSRFGRRRVWMVAGLPFFMLGAWTLFMPPEGVGFGWLLGSSALIYLGWTMIQLPYQAWGAEAVTGYQARARLSGVREAFTIGGVILAASIPMITGLMGHGIDRFTMTLVGLLLMLGMPLAVLISLPSLSDASTARARRTPFRFGELATFRRPFLMVVAAFLFLGFGKGIANAMTVYYATYVLQAPQVVGYVLFAAYAGVLAATPVWVRLTRHIGKHRAIALSLALTVTLLPVLALWLGPGDGWLFVGLEVLIGLMAAGYLVLPPAIVADAVDYDTLKGGKERYGVHFAAWSMAQKLVHALSIGLALPLLDIAGFDPKAVTAEATLAVKILYLVAPAPLYLAGAWILWRFPIDRRRHDIIRRRLNRRAPAAEALHGA